MKATNMTKARFVDELTRIKRQIKKSESEKNKLSKASKKTPHDAKLYRELADSISDIFFAMDKDLRYTYWNKASKKLTGISPKNAIGKTIYELFPDSPETRKAVKIYRHVIKTKKLKNFINEYHLKGKNYIFEINAHPLKNGVSVFVKDITKYNQVQEALLESAERYSTIFEQAEDSIVLIDAQTGRLVDFNRRAHDNLGYTHDEFQKLRINDFEAAESAEEVVRHTKKIIKEGAEIFETKHKTKSGEIRDILVSCRALFIKERAFIHGIWRDITERKKAEEKLLEKMREVERINRLFIGREQCMIDLKREVNSLLEKQGKAKKYEAPDKIERRRGSRI